MTYIVQRKDRFYVVAYDGTDPATGRERRRWYPAGHSRADAEAIVALLGSMPLRSVRSEHLDRLYGDLLATGGVRQAGLAPKTVYEVHVVIRSAFTQAERQRPRRGEPRSRCTATEIPATPAQRSGGRTADQLAQFLAATQHLRLHPVLHLAAFTGTRRGEHAGLRWGDWHQATHRLSIAKPPGRRRAVRRSRSQDPHQPTLHRPRRRHRTSTPRVPQRTARRPPGQHQRSDLHQHRWPAGAPRVDLPAVPPTGSPPRHAPHLLARARHTHASLLVAAGTPIKVVSERLGHANPGFTMATYQHVMPGMGAEAADRFSQLLARHPVDVYRPDSPRPQQPQRSNEPAGRPTR